MLAEVLIRTRTAIVSRRDLRTADGHHLFPAFRSPATRRAVAVLNDGADPETIGAAGDETATGACDGAAICAGAAGLAHPDDMNSVIQAALIKARPSRWTSDVVGAFLWPVLEGERLGRRPVAPV